MKWTMRSVREYPAFIIVNRTACVVFRVPESALETRLGGSGG
jgi:hypothetical protein